MTEKGWSLWTALLAGGVASGILAFLLGSAILRLRGAYFALATIGVNEAMRAFINNFELFGGPTGITLNFSVYKTYGGAAQALQTSFFIGAGLALFALILSYLVRSSKFGLGLLAIRENEDAAEVMGVTAPQSEGMGLCVFGRCPWHGGRVVLFQEWECGTARRLSAARLY